MKHFYCVLALILIWSINPSQAQNDSIYFWKNGALLAKRSIKTADLDSITFYRPVLNLPSVTICNQVWTTQNLDVTTYSDGTPIPQVTDPTQWANLTTGAWCYYNNDPTNGAIYGKLYNWYAVAGIYDAASAADPTLRKKIAPIGWHVPTDEESSTLINCLDSTADGGSNFDNIAGGKMKAMGTLQAGTGLWQDSNTGATNESGFTGLPGGARTTIGEFYGLSTLGYWWSISENSSVNSYIRYLSFNFGAAIRGSIPMQYALSVRCVKD
jgi:uncharacterized protein (TIGR02145 family)